MSIVSRLLKHTVQRLKKLSLKKGERYFLHDDCAYSLFIHGRQLSRSAHKLTNKTTGKLELEQH